MNLSVLQMASLGPFPPARSMALGAGRNDNVNYYNDSSN